MQFLISLGSPQIHRSRYLALSVRALLYGLVKANVEFLQRHQVPSLYTSGVRFRPEPRNWTVEHFDDIPTVMQRGWGDCDDLAPWRLAELWRAGEKGARLRIRWIQKTPDSKAYYHVNVRRADGTIEDPSVILGMPTPPEYAP